MSIIRSDSRVYKIVSGTHKGKKCVIRGSGRHSDPLKISVLFADSRAEDVIFINRGMLAELETPGWEYNFPHESPCSATDYEEKSGINWRIRDIHISQPSVLKIGDVLLTNEEVVTNPRMGCNSTVLVRLSETGWVELASRLPLALKGNQKSKLPIELFEGDRLATGCLVASNPKPININWVSVCLNRESCDIDIPSCIPLALA
jgi:hypothetical protein